ncbi:chorismate mutase [Seinonella peptonophila]|uniref:chorismate mutase n=1 Tax=Seinonella peptonophila TaxID=112248 RepID=A0A1M4TF67_9BACL|nr:chorismate mutase [Seinonella peptonophila]SHE43132.1 chorismate mutase [Seinonella peptonophila]
MEWKVRGIRGAITVEENNTQQILEATKECFLELIEKNEVFAEDVASITITMTHDLNATFPAKAIRQLAGWKFVPLLCGSEIDVPGGLARCIRLLVLVNTTRTQQQMEHVYLRDAIVLRPDLDR